MVKASAAHFLGIQLTDADVFDVPLLATDPYGNFIRGAHGFAQVVMKGADGIGIETGQPIQDAADASPHPRQRR